MQGQESRDGSTWQGMSRKNGVLSVFYVWRLCWYHGISSDNGELRVFRFCRGDTAVVVLSRCGLYPEEARTQLHKNIP